MTQFAPLDDGPPLAVAYLRALAPSGIVLQRACCQRAADQLGVQLVAEYVDIGSPASARRPGLDGLRARLQAAPAVRYVLVIGADLPVRGGPTFLSRGVSLIDAQDLTVICPLCLRRQAAAASHRTREER